MKQRIKQLNADIARLQSEAKAFYEEIAKKSENGTKSYDGHTDDLAKFHRMVEDGQVKQEELNDLLKLEKMNDDDRDLTIFRVEAVGEKHGQPRRYCVDMLDRYDETLGFTSMARVTAFTGAIVARMIARGDIDAKGWVTPEKVITGKLFDRLVKELAEQGVTFTVTKENTAPLEV